MRLKERYQKEIRPQLQEDLKLENKMLIPKIDKAVINVGVGRHSKEKAYLEAVNNCLIKISGQKPVFTAAKKSIAAFKLREGMTVGVKVTMRGQRMYDFVEKLVHITFPRVRDFRGISEKSVDQKGNLTIGFKEQAAFPELKAEDTDTSFGLEVSLSTTAKTREEGLALFKAMGFPFKKEIKKNSK